MRHLPKNRDWEIKTLVRAKLGTHLRESYGGMGVRKPEFDSRTRCFIIKTKGPPFIEFGDAPCGILFRDGSFLTMAERWSEDSELLSFSYHFQKPDPARWRFFRYDRELPDPPLVDKPRHHLHVCSELHCATGPVDLNQVLDVIAELFRRHANKEEVL
jgi:hypothetical protein